MKKRKKINITKVRREIGKMFKRLKGKRARAKAMRAIWRKYKK